MWPQSRAAPECAGKWVSSSERADKTYTALRLALKRPAMIALPLNLGFIPR